MKSTRFYLLTMHLGFAKNISLESSSSVKYTRQEKVTDIFEK